MEPSRRIHINVALHTMIEDAGQYNVLESIYDDFKNREFHLERNHHDWFSDDGEWVTALRVHRHPDNYIAPCLKHELIDCTMDERTLFYRLTFKGYWCWYLYRTLCDEIKRQQTKELAKRMATR